MADSPPQAALAPYRVLDVTEGGYNLGGKILGDLGADVVRIEPPEGSAFRRRGPFGTGGVASQSLPWLAFNVNKRSVLLDLAQQRDSFLELIRGADVLLESETPGRLDALGLSDSELMATNPGLVHVAITPFGPSGPKAGYQATDLTLWAASAMLYLTGDPERPPVRMSEPIIEAVAGTHAATGALTALLYRNATGYGQRVDVSAQVSGIWLNMAESTHAALAGTSLHRAGEFRSLGYTKLRQLFRCKDGYIVYFTLEASWGAPFNRRLADWMIEEHSAPEYFRDMDWEHWSPVSRLRRGDHEGAQHEIDRVEEPFSRFFLTKAKAELFEQALLRGLLVGPVLTGAEICRWDHLRARGAWQSVDVPSAGRSLRFPSPFIRMSETPVRLTKPPPEPGEHTKTILAERREHGTGGVQASVASPAPGAGGGALAGLKVLDFCWVIVGPLTTKFFADHGATVVRVESATRPDFARSFAPFKDGRPGLNRSATAGVLNSSKRSFGLNLSKPAARDLVRRLVERWQPDIITESFAPGTMKAWELDYEAMRALQPNVIYFSTTQLGQTGPFAGFAGFGNLGGAIAGYNELTGWPDGAPIGAHAAVPDMVNPALAAAGLLAAVDYRRRTGKGQYIDLAQVEGSLQFIAPALLDYDVNGHVRTRQGNRDDQMAPHGVFPCVGDDHWIAISVRDDGEWRALCEVAGHAEWLLDQRLQTIDGRKRQEDEIERMVAAWTALQEASPLASRLQQAGIPASPVVDCVALRADPQLLHRGFFRELVHAECGPMPYDGPHFELSITPAQLGPAPLLGGDNDFVTRELLGLSDDAVAELLVEGVLQPS